MTMNFKNFDLISKLPDVGTTIFTVMSNLANKNNAVNLGQGFPDFECDSRLVNEVTRAMNRGLNQYPPMIGVSDLRAAIAEKIKMTHDHSYSAESEITVTAGATQAILTAILALVHTGEEVIVLEPCYDSYAPNIELAGGVVVRVPLDPESFRPNFDLISNAITSKTRAILINSPHNPSGIVWTLDEMQKLETLLASTNVIVISDEVYEHMVFDSNQHQSVSKFPGLVDRAFVISSFGKTFHVTGWKIGFVAAPEFLTREFRKIHQFNVFTVNTPVQYAIASYLQDPTPYLNLPNFYQEKRDFFRQGLSQTKFRLLPCEGSYFQCVETTKINSLNDLDFCKWLTTQIGVAAIPMSSFYKNEYQKNIIRFCFAKKTETLQNAISKLQKL